MLHEVEGSEESRIATDIGELDRVLGGGLVPGGVVLIGGDPGIGKSTLLLQALAGLSGRLQDAVCQRRRIGAPGRAARAAACTCPKRNLPVLPEIRLEAILAQLADLKPDVAVIDSIQTVYSEALTSAPGSVAQVRECAAQLTRHAKQSGTAIILVGHVTKEGAIAGPRVLEHIVDTVLYFEGDTGSSFRLVRAFKNRFGAVNEIGVFAMTEKGLKGVSNPSAIFLSRHGEPVPGSCVLVTQEGTRPLLVEIQALVDSSHAPKPAPPVRRPGAEPARHAARRAAPPRRHRLLRSGCVRQRGRRREDQRARRRPRGAGGDRVVAAEASRCPTSW